MKERERRYEKKHEERIEMSNLKGSSAHHHNCPHYVDVHKPSSSSSSSRLPHPEPRREIEREDIIIASGQKGTGSGQINCTGSTKSGQAQESVVDTIATISNESALKGQKNSPINGSKNVAGQTHEVKTSVRY